MDFEVGDALGQQEGVDVVRAGAWQTGGVGPWVTPQHPQPVRRGLPHGFDQNGLHRLEVEGNGVAIEASVETTAQTGVEMEALTAASVAALTVYDMVKAIDKEMVVEDVRLLEKSKEAVE